MSENSWKGAQTVATAIHWFTIRQIPVFVPVTSDHHNFDLVIWKDERLQKVQCKFTSDEREGFTVKVDTQDVEDKYNDIDVFFIETPTNLYVLKKSDVKFTKTQIKPCVTSF